MPQATGRDTFAAYAQRWLDGRSCSNGTRTYGPAWLDVAHCATNLAIVHGDDVADQFGAAYSERSGREPAPYFDVMDIVGFLPPPGRVGFFDDEGRENRRLEDRLRSVLQQAVDDPSRW